MLELVPRPTGTDFALLVLPQAPGGGADAIARVAASVLGGESRLLPAPACDRSRSQLLDWHRAAWLAMRADERQAMGLVTGPTAGYLPAALDGGANLVWVVREPLAALAQSGASVLKRSVLERALKGELGPGGLGRIRKWANPQTRALVRPFEDLDELPFSAGPPDDADHWRELVFDRAVPRVRLVAPADGKGGAIAVALEMGLDQKQIGRQLGRGEQEGGEADGAQIKKGVRELLDAINWMDRELYEHATSTSGSPSVSMKS